MARPLSRCQEIERSIVKKFRKALFNPFIEAVKRYSLIEEGDKIAVCISGGKDSMLLAKLMELLKRYGEQNFELVVPCDGPRLQRRETARASSKTRRRWSSPSRCSLRKFSPPPTAWKNRRAISVRACGGGHLYAKARETPAEQ